MRGGVRRGASSVDLVGTLKLSGWRSVGNGLTDIGLAISLPFLTKDYPQCRENGPSIYKYFFKKISKQLNQFYRNLLLVAPTFFPIMCVFCSAPMINFLSAGSCFVYSIFLVVFSNTKGFVKFEWGLGLYSTLFGLEFVAAPRWPPTPSSPPG
jgi:hypothetical protein